MQKKNKILREMQQKGEIAMTEQNQNDVEMTDVVYEAICNTIGRCYPEAGGMLGSVDGGKTITHYYFDRHAQTSGATYSPDTETLNQVIRQWEAEGVSFVGMIHSHPSGYAEPSQGDFLYAERILQAMQLPNETLYTPIVQVSSELNGKIRIYSYVHKKQVVMKPQKMQVVRTIKKRDEAETRFDRIASLYPLDVMKRKTIICIGSGGARSYLEDMARSGVGHFIIFEADTVAGTNIATQAVFLSEIGKNKGECIRERILDINPEATVKVIPKFVDDSMCDEEFAALIGAEMEERPLDYLLAGCTDDFYSQARSANLALKYGLPYLSAQLYQNGMASELYFSYPGVTNNSCPRCAMSSRYDAYLKQGAKNNITSAGTPIFATQRTNATKGFISLMLLLYHEKGLGEMAEHHLFYDMLDEVADRNFVMIRMNPYLQQKLQIGLFDNVFEQNAMTCFDETLWIPQTPNDGTNGYPCCPLCGGNGNLKMLYHAIKDSRQIA